MLQNKIEIAFKLFDEYNKQDPDIIVRGEESFPAEYFYAIKLYEWVIKLEPEASESLLLASRCQHIGRWEKPRNTYPEGKAGYLRWRSDLSKYHAEKAGELLLQAGYDDELIKDVQRIVLKKQIKTDDEVQVMENALCLVFLQFQFNEFIKEHDDLKLIRILQKTWTKMSDPGRVAALSLSFSEREKILIGKALGS
jgi:hypothetical protein